MGGLAQYLFLEREGSDFLQDTARWLGGMVGCLEPLTAAIRDRIPVVAVKFHVYDYTIERHHWQVTENHKPWVHPSHVREIG